MQNFSSTEKLEIFTGGRVMLNLPNCKYHNRVYIGRINASKRTFYTVPKTRKKHLFRKTNSLSIPLDLVNLKPSKFLYICLKLDGICRWTSVRALKKYGDIMHFKYQGYEKQIFLELNKWKKTKRRARIERIKIRKGEL